MAVGSGKNQQLAPTYGLDPTPYRSNSFVLDLRDALLSGILSSFSNNGATSITAHRMAHPQILLCINLG